MLPQYYIVNIGGTVSLSLLDRPDNATATIFGPDTTTHVTADTATVDSISTTTNGATSKDAVTVVLANASGISVGDEFWLRSPDEKVRAKTKSNNTVTLWAPCLYDHADGVTAEGSKLTYTVDADNATTRFWDGRVVWNIDGGTNVVYTSVECIEYGLPRLATYADVVRVYPKIGDILDDEVDIEDALDLAHDEVLSDIGGAGRARTFTGSQAFVLSTVYKFLVNVFRPIRGAEDMQEKYEKAYASELEKVTISTPRDEDQDGSIEAHEQMNVRNVSLSRS